MCARTIIGDFCKIPSNMDEDLCDDESYVHNYYKKYLIKKLSIPDLQLMNL